MDRIHVPGREALLDPANGALQHEAIDRRESLEIVGNRVKSLEIIRNH